MSVLGHYERPGRPKPSPDACSVPGHVSGVPDAPPVPRHQWASQDTLAGGGQSHGALRRRLGVLRHYGRPRTPKSVPDAWSVLGHAFGVPRRSDRPKTSPIVLRHFSRQRTVSRRPETCRASQDTSRTSWDACRVLGRFKASWMVRASGTLRSVFGRACP